MCVCVCARARARTVPCVGGAGGTRQRHERASDRVRDTSTPRRETWAVRVMSVSERVSVTFVVLWSDVEMRLVSVTKSALTRLATTDWRSPAATAPRRRRLRRLRRWRKIFHQIGRRSLRTTVGFTTGMLRQMRPHVSGMQTSDFPFTLNHSHLPCFAVYRGGAGIHRGDEEDCLRIRCVSAGAPLLRMMLAAATCATDAID